jgi:hypothetical protein
LPGLKPVKVVGFLTNLTKSFISSPPPQFLKHPEVSCSYFGNRISSGARDVTFPRVCYGKRIASSHNIPTLDTL